MSKNILEKLDSLLDELNDIEKDIILRKQNVSSDSSQIKEENESLRKQIKELQSKNSKVETILSNNIHKLEQVLEKEEKKNG